MTYILLENGNYLVTDEDTNGLPMIIEMSVEQFTLIYGTINGTE